MKSLYIKDLKKGQLIADETFAIGERKRAEDKNGNPYYDLQLVDKTGKISAKIWHDSFPGIDTKIIKEGNVVQINAKVDEYRGNLQLNIYKLEGVDETALEEFMESSQHDPDEMMKQLFKEIEDIKDRNIKQILNNIFDDEEFARKFKYSAAARSIHHDFRSGLLQHIIEMLAIIKGDFLAFYPEVNVDILKAGIILHDIGKVYELSSGISTSYTKPGTLIGHIVLGLQIFEKYGGKDLPEDLYLQIAHLILSHHGKLEFGSPVVPSTIEAVMLSYIDNLSAKAKTAMRAIESIPDDEEFSKHNLWLEGARFWKVPEVTSMGTSDEEEDEGSKNEEEDDDSMRMDI